MEIRPGVYSYDLEWDLEVPLTVQVVETDAATIMLGGGKAQTADQQLDLIDRHDVDIVLVEHGDGDHFEAIPAIQAERTVEVAAPAEDVAFVEGRRGWDRSENRKTPVETPDGDTGVVVDHELAPGECYWGLQTIATPGHTPGNMAFLYEDVLFAGDTVVGHNMSDTHDWSGPLALLPSHQQADPDRARESVRTLLDYDFEVVLITHGDNVIEDGHDAVATLVADLGMA